MFSANYHLSLQMRNFSISNDLKYSVRLVSRNLISNGLFTHMYVATYIQYRSTQTLHLYVCLLLGLEGSAIILNHIDGPKQESK